MEERSAILKRAMDALNSLCLKPPEGNTTVRECASAPPVSVRTDSSVTHGAADGLPPVDPAEWREPFVRWLDSACVRAPRCFGGVGCLHIAFCEWAISHDDVPCNRLTFECLLRESGFLFSDGLVSDLILRDDFEAAGLGLSESGSDWMHRI
jgi:hypothetical protein